MTRVLLRPGDVAGVDTRGWLDIAVPAGGCARSSKKS
jgi:hypothetical protein